VLHLLYSRFITMVLHEAGLLAFEEPFTKFRAHGLIIREGTKMSKSRGNVVNPDAYMDEWGADTLRTYLMFLGPFEQGGDFQDKSIAGARNFLNRLWASVAQARSEGTSDPTVMRSLHRTILKVTEDIPRLSYNTAIAAMMAYMNDLRAGERKPHTDEVEPLVQLVSPFAPHVAEELWERLGHDKSVFDSGWPSYDAALAAADQVAIVVQVNGKRRGAVSVSPTAGEAEVLDAALADDAVAKHLPRGSDGGGNRRRTVDKVIYVPGRLINLVVRGIPATGADAGDDTGNR